ncbi:MAG: TRAP transporter large permease [Proteobacteria bacterium]|nr:TRAP transporter large permease [Pseudomonadota bacterium]
MEWYEALGLLFAMIIVLMGLGFPVAIAFLATNIVAGFLFMGGWNGIIQLLNNGFAGMTTFALVPVPMFLLMGDLFFYTGLATRMFNVFDKLLGRVPARLSYVTVAGGTAFAALSGSSMGSTALLGSLMVPEMSRRGYKNHMSIGPILGTGGLAIIIPPSALAVLLAALARIDVAALLIAGVVPGLVLAGFYALLIFIRVKLDPSAAPAYDIDPVSLREKLGLVATDLLPMGGLIVFTVCVMVLGVATPTEAAAFGALGVLVLAVIYRCLTWNSFVKSVTGALRVTAMAFLIIFGSSTFSQILAFSGASAGFIDWSISFDLPPMVMLLCMFGVLLVLGCFMDQLSMMMLTVPVFFPLAQLLGFDLIWFGIIVLLSLEIGFTTPPFGLLLFVMKGVAPPGTTMAEIVKAGLPFIGCAMLLVGLLILVPGIALWLPNLGR